MNTKKEIKMQQATEQQLRECISCEQLPKRNDLIKMIEETHLAVVGNSQIGVTGLVTRISKVEKKQSRMSFYAVCTMCVIAGAYFGLPKLVEVLFGKI